MTASDVAASYHPHLLARARELVAHGRCPGMEAEDLVQETYVRFLSRRLPFVFTDVRKVHRWLRSTLLVLWRNQLGRDAVPPGLSLDDPDAWAGSD